MKFEKKIKMIQNKIKMIQNKININWKNEDKIKKIEKSYRVKLKKTIEV
jgi:hypothetical protein